MEDLARELRNCRRTFHTWSLKIDTDWEGDPPDFSTAEDRVTRVINLLREFRQSAFKVLGKRCSVDVIGRMPVPELLAKLDVTSANPPGRGGGRKNGQPKTAARKTGRPKGSVNTDLNKDKDIYDLWVKSGCKTKAEFARDLPHRLGDVNEDGVIAAIERHRKRL